MVIPQPKYSIALTQIKNFGSRSYKKLIERFGSAQEVFEQAFQQDKILSQSQLAYLNTNKEDLLAESSRFVAYHKSNNVEMIVYEDDRYPATMRYIPNPPPVLYASRSINLNQHRMLAVVGTRSPSNYGIQFVDELVASLQCYNPVIISGLAYGIDVCAHEAALKYNLSTLGVVAGGLDAIYPKEHSQIAQRINQHGCILSEHPLGVQPERHHFPARNRIIAGMAYAVVIVEAGANSGALITAEYASDYNKEVFALPGNINNPRAMGCNELIKAHKAHLITHGSDIAEIMGWEKNKPNSTPSRNIPVLNNLLPEEQTVLVTLKDRLPLAIEEIGEHMGLNPIDVAKILLQLELKKLVVSVGGNRYTSAI